jgi:iron complex outermembrane receptor protein
MGGELEVHARSFSGLEIGLGLSFLDTELDPIEYLNPLTFETVMFDNEEAVNAPNFTGNLLLRKEWMSELGMLSLQADVSYVGDRKLNLINHPATQGDAYTVGNLRAGWGSDDNRWEASLFVNNVTDEEYAVVASPLLLDTGAFIQIFGPPRTYGVSVRFNYY